MYTTHSNQLPELKATTVLLLIHKGEVVIGADGQATMGNTVAKSNVRKIRKLFGGKILAGFAGSTADAFTLLERFEEKLKTYRGNLKRSAIELAKDWRTDRMLKRLEAMLVAASCTEELLVISGTGDVLEPDYPLAAIGSGGLYAQAAAMALQQHAPHLSAKEMVQASLTIAADMCIYTNHNFVFETIQKEVELISNS
jgi:ATP-dependent HslUV protease subunit HslV